LRYNLVLIPWELLDTVKVPISGEILTLNKRGHEYVIKVDGSVLMDSRLHASEDALAELAIRKISSVRKPCVLVGGLGMGHTLAAALKVLGPEAKVEVSEIMPAVVEWNRGPLSHLAGHPLIDPRVAVLMEDIAKVLKTHPSAYDAVLQDVDNGPEGLTLAANAWLYSEAGIKTAMSSLRPRGVLALWSAKPNKEFVRNLRKWGYSVEEVAARGRTLHRGPHYVVWLVSLG